MYCKNIVAQYLSSTRWETSIKRQFKVITVSTRAYNYKKHNEYFATCIFHDVILIKAHFLVYFEVNIKRGKRSALQTAIRCTIQRKNDKIARGCLRQS